MKSMAFEYHAPTSLDEASDLLGRLDGDVKLIAGGQSLVPMMNLGLAAPDALVDLRRIPGLSDLEVSRDGLRIGAMTRNRVIERSPVVEERLPLLRTVLGHVAHFQIRNRGTIGGSISHADPAAELPALLVALGGSVEVFSAGQVRRTIDAPDLFIGHFTTTIRSTEIVTHVNLPAPRAGWGFHEVSRRHGDYALAGAIALADVRHGRLAGVALALLGVGPTPVRVTAVEESLDGATAEPSSLEVIGELVAGAIDPVGDIHGSAEYRRHVAGVAARRALAQAIEAVAA